ncbi:hypothetical protein ACI8AC_24980 [Geodermatophilus sp. SYSU D00758]
MKLRGSGARAAVVDALDPAALRTTIVDARPDVVEHLLSALAGPAADHGTWLADTNGLRGPQENP